MPYYIPCFTKHGFRDADSHPLFIIRLNHIDFFVARWSLVSDDISNQFPSAACARTEQLSAALAHAGGVGSITALLGLRPASHGCAYPLGFSNIFAGVVEELDPMHDCSRLRTPAFSVTVPYLPDRKSVV